MKTLDEFKKEYSDLCEGRPRRQDETEANWKKRLRRNRRDAGMLREVILALEAGITEEMLRKDLEKLRKWQTVMNLRRMPSEDRKAYEKKYGYADVRRKERWIIWVLKR